MIDEAPALALVILKPETTHTKGATTSTAIDAAIEGLTRCRTSQRRYRNTLVFAAADEAALGTAREVMRKALGWASIKDDPLVSGQLTKSQDTDVTERTKSNREAAEKAIRAAWTHLLYAAKDPEVLDGKPFEIEQTTLLARDRSSIAVSAYEKLSPKGDSIVKEQLGPKILLSRLSSLWPDAQPHLAIADLREWFAAYVYLPTLRDPAVLEGSIAEGVSSQDPQFAYADSFDEAAGRYAGLVLGRLAPPSFAATGLIVRKEVAEAQLERDAGQQQGQGANTDIGTETDGLNDPPEPAEGGQQVPKKATRFFGSVEIDTSRPIRSFESVVTAVVEQLQRAQGAKVKLTLEIEAETPAGFDDADVGVVRDNAKQLKFRAESTGFD